MRWMPAILAAAPDGQVLELGCDTGGDTRVLARHGLAVTGTDISDEALAKCALAVPGARLLHHDLRDPMPFADESFGVVLASLCLHYFEWDATEAIVEEIRRCMKPGGLFLCRLNSTKDVFHGAGAPQEAEGGLRVVNGKYATLKRFFNEEEVARLFAQGWTRLSCAELTNHRYPEPKVAWEVVMRKH